MIRSLHSLMLLMLPILVLVACQETAPVPTLVPTPTIAEATRTSPPPTITPTLAPSATPLPTAVIPQQIARDPAQQATIRLVHAAPAYEPVDFYIEDLNIVGFLSYAQLTEPTNLVAGNYLVRVVLSGNDPETETITEQRIEIQGGDAAIVVFTGTLDAPALVSLREDLRPLDSEQTRVTVMHAMPRGPAFTLTNSASTALTESLEFGNISEPELIPAEDSSLSLQSGEDTLLTDDFRFRERETYTLIVTGNPDDLSTIDWLVVRNRAPGLTNIRVINTLSDIDAVDVYLNEDLMGQSMGPGNDTSYQVLPAITYDVRAYPAGAIPADADPIVEAQIIASPKSRFTILLTGNTDSARIQWFDEDESPTSPEEARFTFVNALETVNRARVETSVITLDLFYGEVSNPVSLPAGMQSFNWQRQDSVSAGDLLETSGDIEVMPGTDNLYIMTGRGTEELPLIYSREVGVTEVPQDEDNPDMTPEPTALPAPQIRVINAINAQPVEFKVDDIPIITLLPGEGSSLLTIRDGERVITAHNANAGNLLAREILRAESGMPYTLIVYPTEEQSYEFRTISDEFVPSGEPVPTMRLINLSQHQTSIGVGHTLPDAVILDDAPVSAETSEEFTGSGNAGADFETGRPESEPDTDIPGIDDRNEVQEEPEEGNRVSAPGGMLRIFERIGPGDDSLIEPVTNFSGTRDLQILDMLDGGLLVSATIPDVMLMNGQHYDVIVYENPETQIVTAYLLAYPIP